MSSTDSIASSVLLEICNLSVRRQQKTVLDNICFTVHPGEKLAVIGPNGAGKSTLLNTIADGSIATKKSSTEGKITLMGKVFDQWPVQARARTLAMLPQGHQLRFDFRIEEVVALGRYPHETSNAINQGVVADCLRHLDIEAFAQRPYTNLSGGEQQRVHLARVLAQVWRHQDTQGRLLLLDEPFTGLDLKHQQQLWRVLDTLAAAGVGIVMSLHDINAVLRHTDRVLVLSAGQQKACGPTDAVINEALLHDIFQVDTKLHDLPEAGRWFTLV